MVGSLNKFYATNASVKGVILNGDLTEFGHPWQLDAYQHYWNEQLNHNAFQLFPGLGNHDYANNVGECGPAPRRTDCAKQSIEVYLEQLRATRSALNVDWDPKEREGSLAYSWNIGGVHFVQLNNYPTYEVTIDRPAGEQPYRIISALPWLRRNLRQAASRGQAIIVNYHDADEHFADDSEFARIVDEYGVSAIFAGHYHEIAKQLKTVGETQVPVFTSGSVMRCTKQNPTAPPRCATAPTSWRASRRICS